jgi:hypothetical protein
MDIRGQNDFIRMSNDEYCLYIFFTNIDASFQWIRYDWRDLNPENDKYDFVVYRVL